MAWKDVDYDPFRAKPTQTNPAASTSKPSGTGKWKDVDYDPFTAQGKKSFHFEEESPSAMETIGDFASEFGRQLESSLILAVKGQKGISSADPDAYDAFVSNARKSSEEFVRKYSGDKRSFMGLTMKDAAESMSNLPFSIVSGAPGAAAGLGTLAITRSPKAAFMAGGVASGAVAYRIDSGMVMQQYLSALDDEARDRYGSGLTKEEEEYYRGKFESAATKHGLWEAIPEGIGNVGEIGILVKPLKKMVGKHLATKVLGKLGGLYGTELATETISQQGQQPIEVQGGLAEGPARSMTSPSDWWQSAKEVAPQVFILSTIMGGVGGGASVYSGRKKAIALKNAVNEGRLDVLPDDVLSKVATQAEDLTGSRPWDKELKSASAALQSEVLRRSEANGIQTAQSDDGIPAENGPTSTEKRPFKDRGYNVLTPEYFEDFNAALETGADKEGLPFSIENAQGLLDAYKKQPGADPASVGTLQGIIDNHSGTKLLESFNQRIDSGFYPTDKAALHDRDAIIKTFPHLTDEANKAFIRYTGNKINKPFAEIMEEKRQADLKAQDEMNTYEQIIDEIEEVPPYVPPEGQGKTVIFPETSEETTETIPVPSEVNNTDEKKTPLSELQKQLADYEQRKKLFGGGDKDLGLSDRTEYYDQRIREIKDEIAKQSPQLTDAPTPVEADGNQIEAKTFREYAEAQGVPWDGIAQHPDYPRLVEEWNAKTKTPAAPKTEAPVPTGVHANQLEVVDLRSFTSRGEVKDLLKKNGIKLYNHTDKATKALNAIGSRGSEETWEQYLSKLRAYQEKEEKPAKKTPKSHYFEHSDQGVTVPLKDIIKRQTPHATSVDRALQRMAEAKAGKRKKRAPLIVVKRHDGKYKIVDGNATLRALVTLKETTAVVEIVPTPWHPGVSTLDDLKKQALDALPEIESITEGLAKDFDGTAVYRPGGGIKEDDSIEKKVKFETDGRYDEVIDTVASTVEFNSIEDLQAAFNKIKKDPRVYEARDRFANPLPGGYRDYNLKIGLGNGHVGELQLHMVVMRQAKESIGHQIYKVMGDLKQLKGDEAKGLYSNMAEICRDIYDSAYRLALESSKESARPFALSSEQVSALANMWETLARSVTLSLLDPTNLYNLREALSNTKGMPSLSRYSKPVSSDIIGEPPSNASITTDDKNVNGMPDLTDKSTAALVSDIFNIINDHIGNRGSLSAKEKTVEESLYQKLKPYLAEIAARAKAKALDVKAYLLGAVDSMPDGQAKDIYEAAADRYVNEPLDTPNKKDKLRPEEGGNQDERQSDGSTGTGTLEGNEPGSISGNGKRRGAGLGKRSSGQADDEGNGNTDDDRDPGSLGVGSEQAPVHLQDRGADEKELSSEGGEVADPESQPRPLKRSGINPGNYRITESDDIGSGTRGEKIDRNLAAIRLVKQLDQEHRYPTKEEQATLAKYVGWGGLKSVFDKASTKPQDINARKELEALLTEDEYLEALMSITNAHYTAPQVIESIYKVIRHLGFTGGNVLEPTYGAGNFIGLMPEDLSAGSHWYGSELDKITAKIGQYLYPDSQLIESGFQDAEFPFGKFDLAIGNPPFGDERITDTSKNRSEINRFKVHNYVISKSGMHLRPGGIMGMVVTSRFLDTTDAEARNFLAKQFRFLGAIRLPNDAFAKNAGTEVTTDIVFLQRLMPDEAPDLNADWLETGATMENSSREIITLNRYFAQRPYLMLGEPSMKGTMYGAKWREGGKGEFTLNKRDGQADTATLIDEVINSHFADLKGVIRERATDKADAAALSWTPNKEDVGIGGFYEAKGKIYLRGDNDEYDNPTFEILSPKTQWTEKTTLGQKRFDRIKGMLQLRKMAYELINAERFDLENIEELRADLNKAYEAFVKEHGFLSESANFTLMADDVRIEFGLEIGFKKEITKARAKALGIEPSPASAEKASILKERVFYPEKEILFAKDAVDGYSISLSQKGRLDIDYIASLTNKTPGDVIKELDHADLIYKDPDTEKWIQEDEYLSGNVKEKYKKVADLAGYEKNAAALKKVFPRDLSADEIKAIAGAPWIPEDVYQAFGQFIGLQGVTAHTYRETGAFRMAADRQVQNEINVHLINQDYGLADVFNAAANNRTLIAYDGTGDDRRMNKERTAALTTIVKNMRQAFDDWIFADAERTKRLANVYNETQNTHAARKFDGEHLRPVGMNPAIELLNTQRDAAWRIVQSPVVLLDHCVGSGKTFTMITGIMERARMGLTKKAMIAVPNHLVGQWAAEFMRLYPGANILAATKKDFGKSNRRRLFARIATGKFDAVIVGHSSFGFIPVEKESILQLVREELQQLERAKAAAEAAKDKRMIRTLVKRIQKKRERIKELLNKPTDNVTTFEAMGVDHLVVDESHEFKNLEYSSAMQNITGMGTPMGSKRAFDLYTKLRWLSGQKDYAITFATGTPISNSLVEMYAILRYLNREGLVSRRLEAFDAWANSYASIEARVEYTASQRLKERVVMASFGNLPELLQLYNQFADTITMDDLKRIYAEQVRTKNKRLGTHESEDFPVPKVENGGRQLDAADASPEQMEFVDYLVGRSIRLEEMGRSNDPKVDNALWIMSDARKMALDIRLVDPSAPAYEDSKANRACKRIKEIYDRTTDVKGTQLVFCDLSTPAKSARKNAESFIKEALKKAALEKDPATLGILQSLGSFQEKWGYLRNRIEAEIESIESSEFAETEQYRERCETLTSYLESITDDVTADLTTVDSGFSVYDEMKSILVGMGIPEGEIKYIHEANTEAQKQELFDLVNTGQVRILLGSSQKMGAGMNVQERLVALHHMDAPWRPSDVEQREGRIVRQGNKLYMADRNGFKVGIYAYSTKNTFDAVSWQILARKASMLDDFRSGIREVQDSSNDSSSYADFMAETTGNPAFREKFQLEALIKELEATSRRIAVQRQSASNSLEFYKESRPKLEETIERREEQAAAIDQVDKFTYGGSDYKADAKTIVDAETERIDEINNALDAEFNRALMKEIEAEWEKTGADLSPQDKQKIAFDVAAKTKIKKPKHTLFHASKLAKADKTGAISTGLQIVDKVNAAPVDETVTFKYGNVEIGITKKESVYSSEEKKLYYYNVSANGLPLVVMGERRSSFNENDMWLLLSVDYIKWKMDVKWRDDRDDLKRMTDFQKQADMTLEKLKFKDQEMLDKALARYQAVLVEVRDAELDIARRRIGTTNKHIERDSRRFGGYDPWHKLRQTLAAAEAKLNLEPSLKEVSDTVFMHLRSVADRGWGVYDGIVADAIDDFTEPMLESLIDGARAEAILFLHGRGDIDKANKLISEADRGWDNMEAQGEDPDKDLQSRIKEAKRIIGSVLKGQVSLFNDALYSARETPGGGVSESDLQELFPGQKVEKVGSLYVVTTRGGGFFLVENVERIERDKGKAMIGYGRKMKESEVIAGSYLKGEIKIAKEGDRWTLAHESVHYLEDAGLLNSSEIATLRGHIKRLVADKKFRTNNKNDIGGAEDRADFIANAIHTRPRIVGLAGRVIDRILKFVDALGAMVGKRTVGSIVREIKSGEIYNKPATRKLGAPIQAAMTKTAAFKTWFGKSKVVDENGDPLVVYHTGAFDDSQILSSTDVQRGKGNIDFTGNRFNNGIYFTANPEYSSEYGKDVMTGEGIHGATTYPVYLSIQNPLVITSEEDLSKIDVDGFAQDYSSMFISRNNLVELKSKGYDGIINKLMDEIVVFDPTQIKSATANVGTYDRYDPDIRYSVEKILDIKDVYKKASFQKEPGPDLSPSTLRSLIKDETDAILQTALSKLPKNVAHMSMLEKFFKSPEYYSHPVLGRIVRLFMRDRNEIYHEYMNYLMSLDDPSATEETLSEITTQLKNKGLSMAEILRGKTSQDYKDLQRIIDEGDTSWVRDPDQSLEEQLAEFEQSIRGWASPDAIRVWKYHRESYDRALELMTEQMRQMIEQVEENAAFLNQSPDYREMYETLKGAMASMETWKGFYAPRIRQGNWVVYATRGKGDDREAYREHRFSEWSANRLAIKLKNEGWDVRPVSEIQRLPEDVYQDLKTATVAKALETAIGNLARRSLTEGNVVTNAFRLNEELLQEVADMIRARGYRASMIHRKPGSNVVRGYIEDPMERNLTYLNNIARGMAKSKVAQQAIKELMGFETDGRRFGGISPDREPKVYSAAKDYIEEQLRNLDATDRIIGWAKSVATFKFLGFSVRSAVVNMTALLTTAPASIHAYVGAGKVGMLRIQKELIKASADYGAFMANKVPRDPDEARFLAEAKRLGWDDPQYTRDAMGGIMKLHNRLWSTMMDGAMYLFGKTEEWNRGTTMLAAYRIARKQGKNYNDAADLAKTASDKAHGVYGRATLPAVAWGRNPAAKIAQMLYVYTKFSHNYLQMLYEAGIKKKNATAALYALLSPVVISGVAAFPLKDITIMPLIGMLLGIFGNGEDPEKWIWDWTREHLGERAEVSGRYGLAGAIGGDISGSLSIGVGIPKDVYEWTGAIGGVAKEVMTAAKEIGQGRYARATEHLLPSGAANIARAIRERSEGVTTERGNRVWDERGKPLSPTAGETALRVLGLRSSRQAALSSRLYEAKAQAAKINEKKKDIYERYRAYLASTDKDPKTFRAIRLDVREFNKKVSDLKLKGEVSPITYESMRRQLKGMKIATKKERTMLQ